MEEPNGATIIGLQLGHLHRNTVCMVKECCQRDRPGGRSQNQIYG